MELDEARTTGASALSTAAIAALYQGNKIEAIKITREEQGIGLKEAKDAVERYVRGQPALQSSLAGAQAQATRSVLLWLAALVALALLVYYFLRKP